MEKKFLRWVMAGTALLASSWAWSADVATVNGKSVTDQDVVQALGSMNEGMRANMLKDPGFKRKVLGNLIAQEVLIQEAQKEKLDQDGEFKTAEENFRKQYLASKILQKNVGSKVSKKAAESWYEKHKDHYNTEAVHVMHILTADEGKAIELLKQVKEQGADFQKIAETSSRDPSAKNNRGDIGFITHEGKDPNFTKAAFAGKVGEIVGPVRTDYGYHIIKIIERKPGKVLTFSDVEGRVINDMRQELAQDYIAKLKEQAQIHVDEKALEKM